MATEVRLPQLGKSMEEGTIIGFAVKDGDEVKKGDIIFEVESDKATLEVESPENGFVKCVIAEPDQTFEVGAPIMVLGDKSEELAEEIIESLKNEAAAKEVSELSVETTYEFESEDSAEEAAEGDEIKLGARVPLNRVQQITGQKMVKSKREIPCFYLNLKVDVTEVSELRDKMNEGGSVKVSYNDFIMRAAAIALERFAIMTGQAGSKTIKLAASINIGLAVAIEDGLVVPVIKDVQKKDVSQIASESQALIEKARENKLGLSDLEGGCITISNLGAFGVESFIPIVVPGQCSILGIGQVIETCVPNDGGFESRKLMNITLSVDHKVANGAYAAQFLELVKELLEDTSAFT
ncbi:MAG: dihydrolipoamide acetyltransferase family protein [Planctomycetota bacterium]|jgi:pyruvate dehydrogenase E2 component (dihydrolipoamide acetyltransferase)